MKRSAPKKSAEKKPQTDLAGMFADWRERWADVAKGELPADERSTARSEARIASAAIGCA